MVLHLFLAVHISVYFCIPCTPPNPKFSCLLSFFSFYLLLSLLSLTNYAETFASYLSPCIPVSTWNVIRENCLTVELHNALERSKAFNLWTHLNAVITSCYSTVLNFDVCRWMGELALGIRTWTLISLEFTANLQLKPSRILSIQQIAHVYHCGHNLSATAQGLYSAARMSN